MASIVCQEPESSSPITFLILSFHYSSPGFKRSLLLSEAGLRPLLHQKHHLREDLLINVNREISSRYFPIPNSFAQSLNEKHTIFNY